MLVLKESSQMNIYQAMLPPELVKLNDEFTKVSAFLDNENFLTQRELVKWGVPQAARCRFAPIAKHIF